MSDVAKPKDFILALRLTYMACYHRVGRVTVHLHMSQWLSQAIILVSVEDSDCSKPELD
jgi:hypothetical protein